MPSVKVFYSQADPDETISPKRWYAWVKTKHGSRKHRLEKYIAHAQVEGRKVHAQNVLQKALEKGYNVNDLESFLSLQNKWRQKQSERRNPLNSLNTMAKHLNPDPPMQMLRTDDQLA